MQTKRHYLFFKNLITLPLPCKQRKKRNLKYCFHYRSRILHYASLFSLFYCSSTKFHSLLLFSVLKKNKQEPKLIILPFVSSRSKKNTQKNLFWHRTIDHCLLVYFHCYFNVECEKTKVPLKKRKATLLFSISVFFKKK